MNIVLPSTGKFKPLDNQLVYTKFDFLNFLKLFGSRKFNIKDEFQSNSCLIHGNALSPYIHGCKIKPE